MIIHDGFLIDFWRRLQSTYLITMKPFQPTDYITAVDMASIWRGRLALNWDICKLEKGCTYLMWLGSVCCLGTVVLQNCRYTNLAHRNSIYRVGYVWEKWEVVFVWLFRSSWHKSICHFWHAERKHVAEYVMRAKEEAHITKQHPEVSSVFYQIYGHTHPLWIQKRSYIAFQMCSGYLNYLWTDKEWKNLMLTWTNNNISVWDAAWRHFETSSKLSRSRTLDFLWAR